MKPICVCMQTTAADRTKTGLFTHTTGDITAPPFSNRFVMQYLAWRVMSGLNESIEISFLLVGHTKFAPDWCFGLLKQRLRRC